MDVRRPLTIAEMATTFGVSHRSLRFYEERGLLRPQRRESARLYGADDVLRLQLVLKGKRLGFSLNEIARLILAHESPRPDAMADPTAHLPRAEIAAKLEGLEAERRRIDEAITELRQALNRKARRPELHPV